ncbi:hypothetical protein MJO29_013790 [Puccinia striiformis f. sp. tritici]|nr:hypothetical protein MJO29_013790 [Puccinia striiformis f. sp. tritici]
MVLNSSLISPSSNGKPPKRSTQKQGTSTSSALATPLFKRRALITPTPTIQTRPKEKQPANPPTLPAKPKERWRGGYKSHATILITTRAATATATITTKVAADPPMTGEATAGMEEITKTEEMVIDSETTPMLRNGTVEREPTLEDQHFLLGYRWNTLLSYSTGIRKYLKFANENAESPTGHDIAANTLVKYLAGLQAWHLYHEVKYPDTKQKKKAAGLAILLGIVDCSVNTSEEGKVIVDSATVAFWGWQEFPSSLPNLNPGPYEKRQHS